MNTLTRCALVAFLLLPFAAPAQVPPLIHYQGRLTDGTNLVNGTVLLYLNLYNASSGGTLLLSDENVSQTVVDGLYSTILGDGVVSGSIASALTNTQVWLEVVVNGTPLSPRERLLAVPYAWMVHGLLTTTNGSVLLNPAGGNQIVATIASGVIGGGLGNRIAGITPFNGQVIAGGEGNAVSSSYYSVVGGGRQNVIDDAFYSIIDGGETNRVSSFGDFSVVGGGSGNRISGETHATIGGGFVNVISTAVNGVIGGGRNNRLDIGAHHGVIAGGLSNYIAASTDRSTIGGGAQNTVTGEYATVSGGLRNQADGVGVFVGGGEDNTARQGWSVVAGGAGNLARLNGDTVGGGINNLAAGPNATVPGGHSSAATGSYSFAAGYRAKARHAGALVWGDSTDADVGSTANNQTTFRSTGGFRIFSNTGLSTGVQVAANSGAWTSISDVNAKEGFAPVDTRDVLEKIAHLPITTWRYRGQDVEIRHMGPTAQDFHAAFGLGDAPGYGITTVDADGVALAAIQALAKEKEEFRVQNAEMKRENEALRAEVEAIKARLGL